MTVGSARKGTLHTFKSKIDVFSKISHLRVVPIGVFTRSDGIYRSKVTAERVVDDGGTGVSKVWNNPKQSLRKHYVGSTWVQIRLYLGSKQTILASKTDSTLNPNSLYLH